MNFSNAKSLSDLSSPTGGQGAFFRGTGGFKIAWRNLMKNKVFSFINIFGLASGMTVCLLAMMKIKGAYDYDTFHPHPERIYRITTDYKPANQEQHQLLASSPLPLGDYLKNNFPSIEKVARVHFLYSDATANAKTFSKSGAFVDKDFYQIFGFQLASGYPAAAPQTIVLTEQTAQLYFGKENPLGKTLTLSNASDFLITGILKKPPFPSHLKFDFLASLSTLPLLKQSNLLTDWTNEAAAYTYVQVKEGVSAKDLKNILNEVTQKANTLFLPASGEKYHFQLQPLPQISPGKKPIHNITAEPIMQNLIGISLIGLTMLLLAFFNYINLTLARSLDRAREVGVRKVSGALRYHLMLQFLCESVLMAILAFGLAWVQFHFVNKLSTVHQFIGDVAQDGKLWIYFIVFTILTGILAGWIPARVLSAFRPVDVLKGKLNVKLFGGVGLRKTLTVIQFSASLIALITLAVFYRQSVYMATTDYGFAREHILNIPLYSADYQRAATTFSSVAGVEKVSGTSRLFGFSGGDNKMIRQDKVSDSMAAAFFSVTPSFIENMNLKLMAGTNIPSYTTNQTLYAIINEEAYRQLQYKNAFDAVGKTIWLNDSTQYQITGVVKDFHFANFLSSIKPLVLTYEPNKLNMLNLRITPGAEQAVLSKLEAIWKGLYPHQPFEAKWFDKELYERHLHKDDLAFIGLLTGMALAIACLGLLGMVVYTTKNRTKEVGVRRVLGAKVWQVVVVISKDFMMLLLLAVVIGLPIGYWVGSEFLQQYVYRINISFGIIMGSAAALLCLGAITIGYQTYQAALANPVKNLRTE
ncbi:MAG: ABC transporter permease [Flavisolibacter sp.]|nr:ABC transporter permease [Flavisolibacter sp.]